MLKPFKLEEYLTAHEFSTQYLLCASDAESISMQTLLAGATEEHRQLWDTLTLNYTEPYGHPLLRQTIVETLYPTLKAEHVLCFAGAEEGIFCALHTLLGPEDHAIIVTPCYQSLLEIPQMTGASITQVVLQEAMQWQLDLEVVKASLRPNTKCLVINFPHNPTGQVLSSAKLHELITLCRSHDIWLFSDEVYRLLGTPKEPWTPPIACLYEKGISLGVLSKAFGLAGLRIGWITCQNKEVLTLFKKVKDYLSICNSAPAELLALMALSQKEQLLARNNAIVSHNIALLDAFFQRHRETFHWVRPQGGCVGFVRYHGTVSTDVLAQRLVEEESILILPSSVYDYGHSHFRIGFGRKNLPETLQKFEAFLAKL
ncbi:MAG: aminotransferase class I/II-fold pyridoxal phosphate-dependent enzyme [Vampirovibrionales bacterium]